MTLQTISPQTAKQLMEEGALLVDIRSSGEYAGEHIAHARNIPTQQVSAESLGAQDTQKIIFYCHSGGRTQSNANMLASCTKNECFLLEGGIIAWKNAGLPIQKGEKQPLELTRQIHIIAGSLIILGIVLGSVVSHWFYILSLFVGAGLLFAGLTGFCGMALFLMKMPWNAPK